MISFKYGFILTTGIYLMIGCNISRNMLYYPQPVSKERLEYINKHFDNVSELTVESVNNIVLHGWIIKKDLQHLPTIFYFGGNGEEVSLNIESFNARLPANVILFNYRGYGLSKGDPSEKALKADAIRIYETLTERFSLPNGQTVAMGRSLGSAVATHLTVHKNIPKTILVTPFESIKEVAYDHFPNFLVNSLLSETYETIRIADQLKNDLLLLAAQRDEIIHPRHAEALYQEIHGDKKLVYIENGRHNTIELFEEYWNTLQQYITS